MKETSIFYDRLRKLIEDSQLSANGLEKALGYSRNTLQNYRNGQEPSATRLIELSDYFGVSPKYLLGQETESKMAPINTIFDRLDFEQKKELTMICQKWLISTLNTENNDQIRSSKT